MKVCDEKITKLKQRIKSELPVYSREQINRSRDVTLKCVLSLHSQAGLPANSKQNSLFKSPIKGDPLRQVFKDQTEQAILRSRQILNVKKEENRSEKMAKIACAKDDSDGKDKATEGETPPIEKTSQKKCSSGKCDDPTKIDAETEKDQSSRRPPILPRNLAQEGFEESGKNRQRVSTIFYFLLALKLC